MITKKELPNKLLPKRDAQFLLKIDLTEINMNDQDDEEIKAIITMLFLYDAQVIEGKLWY